MTRPPQSDPHPRPFDRSFWVQPGTLLGGFYPGDLDPAAKQTKLAALLDVGIRAFVDLTHENDRDHRGNPLAPYTDTLEALARARGAACAYRRCQIIDETAPPRADMRATLDVVDAFLGEGRPVYIHCWGGRGRTGTALGCWLARHGIATGEEALEALRRARRRESALDLPCPAEKSQRALVVGWRRGE